MDLDHLDGFYEGDGFSRDGPEGVRQLDYVRDGFATSEALADSLRCSIRDPWVFLHSSLKSVLIESLTVRNSDGAAHLQQAGERHGSGPLRELSPEGA